MRFKYVITGVVVLLIVAVIAMVLVVKSYDFNKLKPRISQAAFDATGRELKMAGDIELALGLTPGLVVEGVSFENAAWGSRPELATVKQLELQVALIPLLSGNVEVKRLILVEPDILIETSGDGQSNLKFKEDVEEETGEEKKPEKVKLPELVFNEARIENGKLMYKDARSDRAYDIRIEKLAASARSAESPVKIELKGSYNKSPVTMNGTIGSIAALLDPEKSWPVKLTGKVSMANVSLDGGIKDVMGARGISMSVTAGGESLPELASLAEVKGVPDLGAYKVALKVSDPGTKTYKVSELAIQLGENDMAGSAELSLAKKRPQVIVELTSQKLDLRPLLEGAEKKAEQEKPAEETSKPRDKVFPSDPLPLDALRQLDARGKIRVKELLLPRVALNDLAIDLDLEDGNLSATPIQATAGGGSLGGELRVRTQGEVAEAAAKFDVDGVDLGRMLKQLEVTDLLEGQLSADIDLSGRGVSVADIMGSLNGETSIVTGEGKINNKYLNLVGGDLRSEALQLLNPMAKQTDYTEVNCFVSRFAITDGMAKSTALVCDTSAMTVVGDGKINLKTEELSLSLNPSPKSGYGVEGVGKATLSLGELTKPFKLGGTLAKPRLAIDPTKTALTIAKGAGGVALFGPAGIAAILASGSAGGENPCLAAIEAAEKGVTAETTRGETEPAGSAAEEVTGDAKSAIEEAGRSFKKLFGQ